MGGGRGRSTGSSRGLGGTRRRVSDELPDFGGKGQMGEHLGRHKRGGGTAEEFSRRNRAGRVVGVRLERRKPPGEAFAKGQCVGGEGGWYQRQGRSAVIASMVLSPHGAEGRLTSGSECQTGVKRREAGRKGCIFDCGTGSGKSGGILRLRAGDGRWGKTTSLRSATGRQSQELPPKYIKHDAKLGPSSQFAERARSGLQVLLQQHEAAWAECTRAGARICMPHPFSLLRASSILPSLRSATCRQSQELLPKYIEHDAKRGHQASSQSGRGVGCKLYSSSMELRGLSVRAQVRE